MKSILIFFSFAQLTCAFAFNPLPTNVPARPDPQLTQGSLCDQASEYRYPEHIKYCKRDVESGTRESVFQKYNMRYHFLTAKVTPANFKLDHYIPLCAGGSNDVNNLWPQYKAVAKLTDPIDDLVCTLMKQGAMKQEEAVNIVRNVKMNLDLAKAMERALRSRAGYEVW